MSTSETRPSLHEWLESVMSVVANAENTPMTTIIGPIGARSFVRMVGEPPKPRGNARQRRKSKRGRRSMWDTVRRLATLPENDPTRIVIRV